jgi:hypothetical protein
MGSLGGTQLFLHLLVRVHLHFEFRSSIVNTGMIRRNALQMMKRLADISRFPANKF